MDELYTYDEASYDALAANGLTWQDAHEVLHTHPNVRNHIGSVLRVVAQTSDGRWLLVALIEQDDDTYLVVSARELDHHEAAAAKIMIERGGQ